MGRVKGKGNGKGKAPAPKERGKEKRYRMMPIDTDDDDESQDAQGEAVNGEEGDSSSVDSSREPVSRPKRKKRAAKRTTDLTDEEEETMAAWIFENEFIYNKKLNAYKDTHKKNKAWEEQANKLNKETDMIQIWYRSLRTRYGRLLKKKSGGGAAELTERDEWILSTFSFLKAHIYDVKKRTTVSIKAKLAAEADDTEEESNDEVRETFTETAGPSTKTPILDVRPKRSSAKASASEDQLLAGIKERGRQSIALQEKMLDLLKPPQSVTERTTYADWAKSVMQDLDPSLWRRFQIDQSQLLYKYLDLNDNLKMRSAAKQPSHTPSQQFRSPSQQFRSPSQQFRSPSPSSATWQPGPQYWPATVQPGTSVWGSQSQEWVQGQIIQPPQHAQMATLQSMPMSTPTMIRRAPSATATSNLSSIPEANTTYSAAFFDKMNEGDNHNNSN